MSKATDINLVTEVTVTTKRLPTITITTEVGTDWQYTLPTEYRDDIDQPTAYDWRSDSARRRYS